MSFYIPKGTTVLVTKFDDVAIVPNVVQTISDFYYSAYNLYDVEFDSYTIKYRNIEFVVARTDIKFIRS